MKGLRFALVLHAVLITFTLVLMGESFTGILNQQTCCFMRIIWSKFLILVFQKLGTSNKSCISTNVKGSFGYLDPISYLPCVSSGPYSIENSRICHSCRPNCETKITTVEGQYQIGTYTVCQIQYGEEITFDYNSATEN